MVGVVLDVRSEELEKALAEAPGELRKGLRTVLLRAGVAHENVVKRSRFGPYRGESYANRLQRRSGKLAQAYRLSRPTLSALEMTAGIRKGLPGSDYAKLQEFGGTIRPKRRRYLTIPLPKALTPSGVLSGRFRLRKSGDRWETDAGPTFISKGVIFAKSRGKVIPIYSLKKSVTVPPRFGFFQAWDTLERGLVPKLVERETKRALDRGAS